MHNAIYNAINAFIKIVNIYEENNKDIYSYILFCQKEYKRIQEDKDRDCVVEIS